MPLRGPLAATLTVPGAVASWCEAHRRYGQLPLTDILSPAIDLAANGFPVTRRLAAWIEQTLNDDVLNDAARAVFAPDGRAPSSGARLINKPLARSLSRIAHDGHDGFYSGTTAQAMVRYAECHGGFFTERDLERQHAIWGESISARYRDVTIYQTPPPTQGLCVLQMLRILEGFDVAGWPLLSADAVHHLVQAKQLAYHDRDRHLADPSFAPVPVAALLSDERIAAQRALIDPKRALPWDAVPSFGSLRGDTVWMGVVDERGNAVSLVQSLYGVFGSGEMVPDTGIVLQNRSAYFSLDEGHPNCLAPGKKPMHTLIASMAFRNNKLWHVLGCMGADGQPQIHLQAYVALIDHGVDMQQAVEMPRWLSGRFAIGEPRDLLNIESAFESQTLKELERRGHKLNRWPWRHELAGHAHGISIDGQSGMRFGGADPRSDGAAVGY